MLSVVNKPFMLNDIMLNVVMLSDVMQNVIMLSDVMQNVVMPSVVCCVSGHWDKHSISRVPFASYKVKKFYIIGPDLLPSGSVDTDFRGFTVFVGSKGNFPLMNHKGLIIRELFCIFSIDL
jgi:hypothetical protein